MVPQQNTTAENGHSTMQNGTNKETDNRWTKHMMQWCPQDHKWPRVIQKDVGGMTL